jgi:hypothetical protein
MDNYDKETIIEFYVQWLTTSTVTFAREILDGKGYGYLPEREVQSISFEECTMNLIGPWKIQEKIFKLCYRTVTSEMCALQQKYTKIWLAPMMSTI